MFIYYNLLELKCKEKLFLLSIFYKHIILSHTPLQKDFYLLYLHYIFLKIIHIDKNLENLINILYNYFITSILFFLICAIVSTTL